MSIELPKPPYNHKKIQQRKAKQYTNEYTCKQCCFYISILVFQTCMPKKI